ncbi:MAG: DegT/DnrJ/EryC1/StrS family aminotransferase [Desulfovibrio sp.]|nr:DegT/DnrJ/EryC1/StrS family aminotransferase [Desulfovibrio sp.]MBI4960288.1 DegT/DnrJ/EryC1/StrS family aminotransferase [Desulfovibrio sp.]
MTIPVWGYLDEYESLREEFLQAVDSVFSSGKLILGPNVEAFEKEFAAYCGTSHGVGLDNGTNALTLALLAAGLKPGGEVVTTSNTAVPTVAAIVNAGGVTRFCDIDPRTYLMDPARLEAAVTPKTAAIVPVHLYGQMVDMEAVNAVAKKHGLLVVEDCAQAHGATRHGNKAGSLSSASAFSFYPTKLLGAYGDGGMALTNDPGVEAKLRRLRFYGMEKTYYSLEQGYNSRLDEVHAAMLRIKLKGLDAAIARRRKIAARYDEALADSPYVLPATAPGNEHAYYLYVVRHQERDRIMEQLKLKGILLNISYPWPIHTMPGYAHLGYPTGALPHTEAAAKCIFSLPMYPGLTPSEQEEVIDALLQLA